MSRFAALTVFLLGASLAPTRPYAAQTSCGTLSVSREQMRAVVLQARDALVEFERQEHGGNTGTETEIHQLVLWLLLYGEQRDLIPVRQAFLRDYPAPMRDALEPASTLQDFASRARRIENETNDYLHDDDLNFMISEEIARGMLDDASRWAAEIRSPVQRMRSLNTIAILQHENHQDAASMATVDAAIQAGFDTRDSGPEVIIRSAQGILSGLAASFHSAGFDEAARRVLERERCEVESVSQAREFTWEGLASGAVQAADLPLDEEALAKAGDFMNRASLEEGVKQLRALQTNPQEGVRIALTVADPSARAKTLCALAERQASAGDRQGAAATLQQALAAANEMDQFRVDTMVDVAWTQIHTGDLEGAEKTLKWALEANEDGQWIGDKDRGWIGIAEALAFLGQFERARRVAGEIDDHSDKAEALNAIAYRQTSAGCARDAIAWASRLEQPEERKGAFFGIATAMFESLGSGPIK